MAPTPGEASVVVAGGYFWGVQGVFQHVKGVKQAVSGYAGGKAESAHYDIVSSGATGHAESVKITYDPAEDYHQNYLKLHPNNPYVAINNIPKEKTSRAGISWALCEIIRQFPLPKPYCLPLPMRYRIQVPHPLLGGIFP